MFRILTAVLLLATVYYVIRYRIIDPWPAKFWCPWLEREEVISIRTMDTLKILNWLKEKFGK